VIPISEMNNDLRNDEINKKQRDRYAKDTAYRKQVIENQRTYRKHHREDIAERRWKGEACEILLNHADEHNDDDDRLTTDFIADQLEKFKDKLYDETAEKLLTPET